MQINSSNMEINIMCNSTINTTVCPCVVCVRHECESFLCYFCNYNGVLVRSYPVNFGVLCINHFSPLYWNAISGILLTLSSKVTATLQLCMDGKMTMKQRRNTGKVLAKFLQVAKVLGAWKKAGKPGY